MFTWGMREGLVLANPVVNTNKREDKPLLTDREEKPLLTDYERTEL